MQYFRQNKFFGTKIDNVTTKENNFRVHSEISPQVLPVVLGVVPVLQEPQHKTEELVIKRGGVLCGQ